MQTSLTDLSADMSAGKSRLVRIPVQASPDLYEFRYRATTSTGPDGIPNI